MKRRHPLRLERLEARETPDVSFGPEALLPAPPLTAQAAEAAPAFLPPAAVGPFAGPVGATSLDAVFADPGALQRYLSRFAPEVPADEAVSCRVADAEATRQGWSFLCRYTNKAIRGDEARRGPLPDHEDVVQQVYLEWRQEVGPGSHTLPNLLAEESAERAVLRASVPRVIARARYHHARQRDDVELDHLAAPERGADREWQDWRIDAATGAGGVSRRDRRIVELRGEGATFEEIGRELGLPRQRACEAFNAALARLRRAYSD